MKKYFLIGLVSIVAVIAITFLSKILPVQSQKNFLITNSAQIANQSQIPEITNSAIQPTTKIINQRAEAPIFFYHHIRPFDRNLSQAELDLTVWQNIFEEQLNYFSKNGFNSISLEELRSYFYKEIPLPSRPYILTFDDSYEDFYQVAWPLLQKYQVKATIFIITDFIGQPGYLSWPEIEELAQSYLIEFGAHTLDHKYLSLSPPELTFYRLSQEIFGPKAELEKRTSRRVEFFSYPYGQYNYLILNLVKEAKYLGAVTTDGGVWQEAEKIYELKRLRLSNGDTADNLGYRLKGLLSVHYFNSENNF
jgi:peptidoglycan/xylan/chitin deacetylase (PgdA/CDA1 family)